MRLSPLFVSAALLGCGNPCDDHAEICDPELRFSEVGLLASPASLDGDFAPLLASCRVVYWSGADRYPGTEIYEAQYDARGRLEWESQGPPSEPDQLRQLVWEGPCRSEEFVTLDQGVFQRTTRCDPHGWSVASEQVWTGDSPDSPIALVQVSALRRYRGQQLIGSEIHTRYENLPVYRDSEELVWQGGHPVELRLSDDSDEEPRFNHYTWSAHRLTAAEGDATAEWIWRYDQEGQLADEILEGRLTARWLRREGAIYPHAVVQDPDTPGEHTFAVDFRCD